MLLQPYLIFSGNCKEAFTFYEKVLGGKIETMMTFEESPDGGKTAPELRGKIMHATLTVDDAVLMASDSPPEHYQKPQGSYVSIGINDVADAERIYKALAENATIQMPLQETFWAARFAMFTDRFGTPWMVNCSRPD